MLGLGIAALFILAGHLSVPLFFGAMVLSGMGNGMTTPNASVGVMSIRPRIAGSASGLSAALIVLVGAVTTTITGAVVSETNGAFALPFLMCLASLIGLGCALLVRIIDRREACGT